ncbi:uncharacterized protein K452DRAFT_361381 [Aplosporella prunicola CBS 121167]|uniref:Uncharacterized protein n=1 Tax=Aplosporella prunicola CBS 121167 TaxID=1176127 RepID=A0A6A6B296_9PEZI|nr:uncharacterized protein K452DRAFT_361381 [Aplosporella prunicola CBS 121167]KAF2138309.1 hypothetical protein K452DRAFT_361381 [Aplosporella prunicola CBS 121167]
MDDFGENTIIDSPASTQESFYTARSASSRSSLPRNTLGVAETAHTKCSDVGRSTSGAIETHDDGTGHSENIAHNNTGSNGPDSGKRRSSPNHAQDTTVAHATDQRTNSPLRWLNYREMILGASKFWPHLKNVGAAESKCRNIDSGCVTVHSSCTLWNGHLWVDMPHYPVKDLGDKQHLISNLAHKCLFAQNMKRFFIVEDLTPYMINTLGTTFGMNPEFFEEHLLQSGFLGDSQDNEDSATWRTNGILKDYFSLRWFRPVLRRFSEPPDKWDRLKLISNKDQQIEWGHVTKIREEDLAVGPNQADDETVRELEKESKRGRHCVSASSNIFRQERALITDRIRAMKSASGAHVAWEERATMYRTVIKGVETVVLLVDPLPRLNHDIVLLEQQQQGDRNVTKIKSSRRVSEIAFMTIYPRSAPVAFLGCPMASNHLDDLEKQYTRITPTRDDINSWLYPQAQGGQLYSHARYTEVTLALLQVVKRDVYAFMSLLNAALGEIAQDSINERSIEERLPHWRSLINTYQQELPKLRESLQGFYQYAFAQKYDQDAHTTITDLDSKLELLMQRLEKTYVALRAELAIIESKRGIAEAEGVSKLTELAFIFIPLTFAAGVFSMQIQELQDPASLRSFIVAAFLSVAVSYAIRLAVRSPMVIDSKERVFKILRERKPFADRVSTHAFIMWLGPGLLSAFNWAFQEVMSAFFWLCYKVGAANFVRLAALSIFIPVTISISTQAQLSGSFRGAIIALLFIVLAAGTWVCINAIQADRISLSSWSYLLPTWKRFRLQSSAFSWKGRYRRKESVTTISSA